MLYLPNASHEMDSDIVRVMCCESTIENQSLLTDESKSDGRRGGTGRQWGGWIGYMKEVSLSAALAAAKYLPPSWI